MRKINDKEMAFIDKNYKGVSCVKMAQLLYENLGTKVNKSTVNDYYLKKGYKSGLTGKFNKNFEGMSEDKINRIKSTQFKKGHPPTNHKPIGTISRRADYNYIKVSENNWELLYNVVWEQHHGPKPKGTVIMHIDGNRHNDDINNLILVNKDEELLINQTKLTDNAALNKVIINNSRLQRKIMNIKK